MNVLLAAEKGLTQGPPKLQDHAIFQKLTLALRMCIVYLHRDAKQ